MTSSIPGDIGRESGARPEWTRRDERGSASMLRLMTWISLRLGRRAGRCALPLIAAYFLLLAAPARRASRLYLRRALQREPGWRDLYRHVHFFASTLHDRIYLINDRFELFDIEVRGGELITDLLAAGRGAFLVGAHLGSFEVLRALARENLGLDVAIAMYEENARKINAALAAVNPAARQDIIPLGRVDSMLQIRQRLHDGAIVGILGDRTVGGDAAVPVSFLGEPATLPSGPFRLAAMLQRPVIFMAGLYLGGNRYRIHFEMLADFSVIPVAERDAALHGAVERFAAVLERHCRAAPYNWFNFFDFWQSPVVSGATRKARR
ncbi:MAG: acyl-CoA synthetase [Aromatoleum sp.]|nr:acyl-CoA synthetase [Aromatoleum sp.]